MARHEDDDVVMVERGGSPVGPFIWGIAVGAALGLLFAPMSGRELRREMATRGRELKDMAADKAEELEEMVSDGFHRARGSVEESLEGARRSVKEGKQYARDVADAGRSAAVTAREELERRLAEAREARRAGHKASGDEEPVA
jgi:gas vesicle protein